MSSRIGNDRGRLTSGTASASRDSWQPELRVGWQKALTSRWSVLTFYRYLHLDSAMTDSPLVQDNSVQTWFVGMSYRFY